MQASQPGNGVTAHPFQHHGNGLRGPCGLGVVCAEKFRGVAVCEGRMAGSAAPSLDSALAVGAETIGVTVVAAYAGQRNQTTIDSDVFLPGCHHAEGNR